MSGTEIKRMMRAHGMTIRELSRVMDITIKRIRFVRENGIADKNIVRDWIEGITGADPGLDQ